MPRQRGRGSGRCGSGQLRLTALLRRRRGQAGSVKQSHHPADDYRQNTCQDEGHEQPGINQAGDALIGQFLQSRKSGAGEYKHRGSWQEADLSRPPERVRGNSQRTGDVIHEAERRMSQSQKALRNASKALRGQLRASLRCIFLEEA